MTTSTPPQQDVAQAIDEAFGLAVAQHQAGQTQKADELYRMILQLDPRHAPANHNLGLLAMQAQQTDAALGYFNTALDADPAQGQYWLSYIDALAQTGQADTARQVLALAEQQGLQGEQVEALKARLGVGSQSPATSPSGGRQPAPQNSKVPDAKELKLLEDTFNKGRYAAAAEQAQSLMLRYPQHWAGWKMLGVVLSQMGRNEEALSPMQKAAALSPKDAEAHNNLGIVLSDLGRHAEAVASFRHAVKLKPGFATAHSNLAASLQRLGRFKEAEASCRQALKLNPNYADALGNLGGILNDMGRAQEAENVCRRALKLDPEGYAANGNLALTLKALGRLDEAEVSCLRAMSLRPDLAETHANLGGILHEQGRLQEAVASFRRVLDKQPDNAVAFSNLLFCLAQSSGVAADELFEEHCRFGERYEAPFRATVPEFSNSREAERKLRVGFVSGDLRSHVVATYIEPILSGLDGHPQLELYAYSNHIIDDDTSKRLRGHFAHWQSVVALSDAELAEQIRTDGIDILIDLSGHTARNRLLTFARKPAPVQASWIGYPCTTGLRAMDYYLTDRGLVPSGAMEQQFTEKIVHLPASVPFLPSKDAPAAGELPALKNGYVTFGSFNRLSKLNPEVIALWARLLQATPDSKMLLAGMPQDGGEEKLGKWFAEQGIARERLIFKQRCSMADYLALHQQVDISLDTFPYSGGTTTLHALWMGVPTLTLAGDTPAARSGASILGNVGLDELVAHDAEEFVSKGRALAGDLAALSVLREGLRQRVSDSPMSQPELLAASLAQALRVMWRRWCADGAAQAFEAGVQEKSGHSDEGGVAMKQPNKSSPIFVTQPLLPPLEEFIPYLQKIWDSKQLTNNGPYHQELEQELAKYLGVEHISLFANATLALVTALQALRVTGEVITTPYSFVASSHALDWNGIRPVFVDIDPVTLNLDPKKIEAAITPHTTGILPVHVYGVPCAVDEIERIADTYGLKVIYDAAHTFGMRLDGNRSVLEYGDMSILSFHATKVFNTFEGGAIICRDAKTKHRIDYLKNFGFADEVTVIGPGINGKMNEVQAAFGLLQLKYIDDALERRKKVDARYRAILKEVRGIRMHAIPDDIRYNYAYFPIFIEDDFPISRDELYRRMRECGVYARRYFYPLISEFPVYRGLSSSVPGNLPVATDISQRVLCLPMYPDLDEETQDVVVECLHRALRGEDK
ncbi:MAG TPA: hypothetical protein DCK83_04420 [Gallionellaceae bacterium]|nr:hypothetical protein [Gallionellaceae bacterium]